MANKNIYKPNYKKLKNILSHSQIHTVFSSSEVKIANEILEKIGRNGNIQEKHRLIESMLSVLLKIVINKPITPLLKDLTDEFIIALSYENESTIHETKIRENILTLRKMVDYHLTVIDAIKILKHLIKRVDEIQKFAPPSFELSKHYLKVLQNIQSPKKNK
jgi:hypothetical protein